MLHLFVWDTEELYGIKAMTYNVHLLLHLCKCVMNWGPLWSNSTFYYESENHRVLKAIKCAKGVTQQIARFVNLNNNLHVLEGYVSNRASEQVMFYCYHILERKVYNMHKKCNIYYFGHGDVGEDYYNLPFINDSMQFYDKIVKDGCLYESNSKTKNRSNNSFVLLNDGRFVNILCFIIDELNDNEIMLCNVINVVNYLSSYKVMQKVQSIQNEIRVEKTTNIRTILFFVLFQIYYIIK